MHLPKTSGIFRFVDANISTFFIISNILTPFFATKLLFFHILLIVIELHFHFL